MRSRLPLIFMLGSLSPVLAEPAEVNPAVTPAMQQEFEQRLRHALAQENPDAYLALRHNAGTTPESREMADEVDVATYEHLRANAQNMGITFKTPAAELEEPTIFQGKRYRSNLPIGITAVVSPSDGEGGSMQHVIPLGVHAGKLVKIGMLEEDLNWKGPPDRSVTLRLSADDATPDFRCAVEVHTNPSGVPVVHRLSLGGEFGAKFQSLAFWSQEIKKIILSPEAGSATVDGITIMDAAAEPESREEKAIPAAKVSGTKPIVLWPANAVSR